MIAPHGHGDFRVLLIEDSASDARFVKEGLSTLGAAVALKVVKDGQSALEYLRGEGRGAQRPDLIILDLNLPGMKGHDVLSAIRSDDGLTGLPVAIMSSSNRPDDVSESYRRHANCHVTKPLDLDDYLRVIHQLGRFWLETATTLGRESALAQGGLR